MSVVSEIQRIKNNIMASYTNLDGKGAVMPDIQDSNNLAEAIQSINVGNITSEVVKKTLTEEATSITFNITSGKVPKAIELWNANDDESMQSGEIRKVFFINQAGAMYRNNRVNGINAWFACSTSGDNVSNCRVTMTNSSVTIGRVSNTYYLADVEYKLTAYYWEDSQKTSTITVTSNLTNANSVSNFLKNYTAENSYTVFTTTEENVSNLPNNGMLSYTIRNENGTNVVLGGSRYRNGVQEPITQPANVAYDCVLNNGDKIYRTVIPLDGKVYKDDSELIGVLAGNLEELSNENVKTIAQSRFSYSDSLKKIDLPNCTYADYYAFRNCSSLTDVNLPKLTSIRNSVFYGCASLVTLDLPSVTNIEASGFPSCTKLTNLVLRRTSAITTLANVNAFQSTPFRNGTGGTVYVPRDLVSSYESATNWSSLESTTFAAIEDNIATLEALGLNVDEFKD